MLPSDYDIWDDGYKIVMKQMIKFLNKIKRGYGKNRWSRFSDPPSCYFQSRCW